MKQFTNETSDVVVLQRGDNLFEKLNDFARERGLKGAWLEGLGGTAHVVTGIYNLEDREYKWREWNETLEILSLTGNLAWVDGEPFWHIHGVLGTADYNAVGGHIKELTVGPTCELRITPLEAPSTRVFDDETGLKLLS